MEWLQADHESHLIIMLFSKIKVLYLWNAWKYWLHSFYLVLCLYKFSRKINSISITPTWAEVVSFSYPHSWNTSSPTCLNSTIPWSFFFYIYWLISVSFNGPSIVYLFYIITTPGLTTGMFSVLSIYAIHECLS